MLRNHTQSQNHKVNPHLSTRLEEKREKIQQILTELAEESAKGTAIIVEGQKDVAALRSFGAAGPVLTVKTGGKSFTQVMDENLNVLASGVHMDQNRRYAFAIGVDPDPSKRVMFTAGYSFSGDVCLAQAPPGY